MKKLYLLLFCGLIATAGLKAQTSGSGSGADGDPVYIDLSVAPTPTSRPGVYIYNSGVLTISGNGLFYQITGVSGTVRSIVVQPSTIVNIEFVGTTTMTNAVSNYSALAISEYAVANLWLESGSKTTLIGSALKAGLFVHPDGKVVIDGYGELIATGGEGSTDAGSGAGIGGHGNDRNVNTYAGSSGEITIKGGTITATGGITNAANSGSGAGIGGGGGRQDSGGGTIGLISITGGTVIATGGLVNFSGSSGHGAGAGIGGGGSGGPGQPGGNLIEGVVITGGTVTAIGGESKNGCGGAGIGGGGAASDRNCGNILPGAIVDLQAPPATITAEGGKGTGGNNGSDIGSGGSSSTTAPTVTISDKTPRDITIVEGHITGELLNVSAWVLNVGDKFYQWYRCDGRDDETLEPTGTSYTLSGENSDVYLLDPGLTEDEYYYYCEVYAKRGTNPAGPITISRVAKVTVLAESELDASIRLSDGDGEFYPNNQRTVLFEPRAIGGTGFTTGRSSTSVTVTNTGNVPFIDVTVPTPVNTRLTVTYGNYEIDGVSCAAWFDESKAIGDLFVGTETNFSLQTETGLSLGRYTATVTISESSGSTGFTPVSFDVQFDVVPLIITGINVATPPQLEYIEGELLNLSTLVLDLDFIDLDDNSSGTITGVNFEDATLVYGVTINFTDGIELGIGHHNRSVTARWGRLEPTTIGSLIVHQTFEVTVSGGSFIGAPEVNGKYPAGAEIELTAGTVSGKTFSHWTVSPSSIESDELFDATNPNTKFEMPADDVEVTAHFGYSVTFSKDGNGTLSAEIVGGSAITSPAVVGDDKNVKLTATPQADNRVGVWIVDGKMVKGDEDVGTVETLTIPVTGDIEIAVQFVAENEAVVIFMVADAVYHKTSAAKNSTVSRPADPEEEAGNIFTGWYKKETFTVENLWQFGSDKIDRDTILYAGWESINTSTQAKVTFDGNGGEPEEVIMVVEKGLLTKPADPEKANSVFTGWYKEKSFTIENLWQFGSDVADRDTILYAGWEIINTVSQAKVTFDGNGGEPEEVVTVVSKGGQLSKPADPEYAGYVFTGWYKEKSFTVENLWQFGSDKIDRDTILYAGWEFINTATHVKVTFDGNGGIPEKVIMVVEKGLLTKPTDPEKANSVFTGWYKEKTYTIENLWQFGSEEVDEDIILYAGWETIDLANQFIVTFDGNGGEPEKVVVVVNRNATVSRPDKPTKEDYIFTGWFTDDGFLWDFDAPVTGNMTLFAGWVEREAGKYAVTFVYNDGITPPDTKYVDDDNLTPVEEPEEPERENYIFMGWFTIDGIKWEFDTPVTADTTLAAGWIPVNFTVTFDAKGGLFEGSSPDPIEIDVPYNDPIPPLEIPKDPTKEDHIFTGWYEEVTGKMWNFNNPITRNVTLNAGWEERREGELLVIFFANGGVFDDGETVQLEFVAENQPIPIDQKPDDPVREDYTFTGWYKESSCKTLWNFNDKITYDMFLYAGWAASQAGKYAVTFAYNDGVTPAFTDYVTNDDLTPVNRPIDPVHPEGQVFTGWFTIDGFIWDFAAPVKEDMTLIAGWTASQTGMYAVTFVYNDGVTSAFTDYVTNDDLTPVNRPIDPIHPEGQIFTGWFTVDGFIWDFAAPVKEDMTLIAGWTASQTGMYAVTFVYNDGVTSAFTDYVTNDDLTPVNRPIDPIHPEGQIFTGWFTVDGFIWDFAAPVKEDMTLIAGWTASQTGKYAVTFVYNDGVTSAFTDYVTDNNLTPVNNPGNPPRAGYIFTGWFTVDGILWNFAAPVKGDMTLIAGWIVRETGKFAVNFVGNGGTPAINTVQVLENTPVDKPDDPIYVGYRFLEWYTEWACENSWDFDSDVTGDMFLYAGWKKVYTINVTVNNNDYGSVTGGDTYDANDEATVTATPETGYEFLYWEENGAEVSESNPLIFTVTEDRDLMAVFKTSSNFEATLDFDTYVVMKWSNTLMLDLKQLAADDYAVTGCKWYKIKNGAEELIGSGNTYSVGPRSSDLLEAGVTYYFVLSTSNKGELRSTDKIFDNLRSSLLAYPNPVRAGNMLTIEGVDEGGTIEVYNQSGVRVSHTIANGVPAQLNLNVPSGIYVIRTKNGEVKIVVNNY